MMLTMMNISASRDAWGYLLDTVSAEHDMERASGKAAYYMAEGTPPGRWAGSGLQAIGLQDGENVKAAHLTRLYGQGVHPFTEESLGKKYQAAPSLEQRVASRLADGDTRPLEEIVEEESSKKQERSSVAGFELVFSPPKSVSTWWAVADPSLKAELRDAHETALAATLKKLERDAARTRIGTDGVAQAEVIGIIAAQFDHWESREGDPQLHTHVLVSNRVQGLDGRWRTLDSRGALTPSIIPLGQYYDTVLMDTLSQRFGVDWTVQEVEEQPEKYRTWLYEHQYVDSPSARANFALAHGADVKNLKWQIAGVGRELREEYSTRSQKIRAKKNELIESFKALHGRDPSDKEVIRMRQAATLRTRDTKKRPQSLKSLTSSWRERADRIIGDSFLFGERIKRDGELRLTERNLWSFRADDISEDEVQTLAQQALHALAQERSTWSRWNAEAAVSRLTAAWRFRSIDDRDAAVTRLTDAVLAGAIALTPENPLHTPRRFQTADGDSQFRPKMRELYTTREVWDAEERLLAASRTDAGPRVTDELTQALIDTPTGEEKRILSDDQAAAVQAIVTSGRVIDVLVGPAGAGKTTSLEKLKEIWEAQHGAGTVRGLAPTAKAAAVLAESLNISTENTAKWLTEVRRGTTNADGIVYELNAGDLVIVDEASIGGTLALDELREQAERSGAKLLLVGDWAQLAAVDAGGAFGLIAEDMDHAPELVNLHRFSADWEGEASKLLRLGRASALDTYIDHERISWGSADDVLERAVEAWKQDELTPAKNGEGTLTSLLIAPTNKVADELNMLAREWRIEQGLVDGKLELPLKEGAVSVGDKIVTRKNNRRLTTSHDRFVKNNDEWVVRKLNPDGSLLVASEEETVTLPPNYVANYVQLGYAATAHRAQGRTVDTAHTIIDDSTSRETLYVGLTRGKHGNHGYVVTGVADDAHQLAPAAAERTWREVLNAALLNRSGDVSAHQTAEEELDNYSSVRQTAAEYQSIVSAVLEDRYLPILEDAHLITTETLESPYLGPLLANMRRVEAFGEPVSDVVAALLSQRGLEDARNPLAVLHHRIEHHLEDLYEHQSYDRFAPMLESFGISLETNQQTLRLCRTLAALEQQNIDLTDTIRDTLLTVDREQVENVASLLGHKLRQEHHLTVDGLVAAPGSREPAHVPRIAGLIPELTGAVDDDTRQALTERAHAIRQRAELLVDQAIANDEPWISELGEILPGAEGEWRERAVTVACYRDLYGVETESALGREYRNAVARTADRNLAQAALRRPATTPVTTGQEPGTGVDTLAAMQHQMQPSAGPSNR